MPTHEHYRELLALHALGAVEEAEREALEAHVVACASCAADLEELRDTAADLALLATPTAPSPESVPRLLAALDAGADTASRAGAGSGERRPARRRRRWRPRVLVVRVAVAAVVVGLGVSHLRALARLEGAHLRLERVRAVGRFVTSPRVTIVPMWGAASTHAKLAYDDTTGRFMLLSPHLPPLPERGRYQLWVMAEQVQRAGTFAPDSFAGTMPAPPRGDEPFRFAVTIEPDADVDEPMGPIVLMSPQQRREP